MPKAKQKINKGMIIFIIFVTMMIGVTFLPVQTWAKIVTIIALAALFVFVRRSFVYFARAAKMLQKDSSNPLVWETFKKAIANGLDEERIQLVGSAFIQQGDADYGVQILEDLVSKTKVESIKNEAITSLSMGYWRQGKIEKAIEILQNLEKDGYYDDNLTVNLQTYLLENGDLVEAKKLIDRCEKEGTETNGMLDNKGWYYIIKGDWKKASEIYTELAGERNAKFPEAYLHAAQVKVHEGDIDSALGFIDSCLSKRFILTCGVKKDYVETLQLGLENPQTRESFAKAMDENQVLVSNGQVFPGYETACDFEREELEVSSEDDDNQIELDDDDDREPNTDLDDEDYDDEEYQQELAETPNTDVDDDDREPNTDLDDEDL